MARITIRRELSFVPDHMYVALRDVLLVEVADVFQMPRDHVEICEGKEYGPLDINHPRVAIDIDTGKGKNEMRAKKKFELVILIAQRIAATEVLPREWLNPLGPYVWMQVCESAFAPIGYPKLVR